LKGKDQIKDLFSDKLGGFEAKVNPELWGKVASQIGAGSAATTTGMSLVTKFIIGISAASVVTVATVLLLNPEEESTKEVAQVTIQDEPGKETPQTELIETVPETVEADEENNIVAYTPQASPVVLTVSPVLTFPVPDPEEKITKEDDPLNVFKPHDQLPAPEVGKPSPEEVDAVLIDLPEEVLITSESTEIEVFLPNVFTPNNDGTNDFLFIQNAEDLDENGFFIKIVDENYGKVFESTDPYFKWNGTGLGGEPLKNGYYIAFITSKDKEGKEAKPVMYQFQIRK